MDWQPIETAPEGESLLIWQPDGETGIWWDAVFIDGQWVEEDTGHVIDAPSHWARVTPPAGFLTIEQYNDKYPLSPEESAALDAAFALAMRKIDGG